MKNIKYIILLCLFSISFVNAQTPTASMTLDCNLPFDPPNSSNFMVEIILDANHIQPNNNQLEITLSYDPTIANCTGLSSTNYPGIATPIHTTINSTTKETKIIVTASSVPLARRFFVDFIRKCPQTCFGDRNFIIKSIVKGAGVTPYTTECSKIIPVQNKWSGTNSITESNYDCKDNIVKGTIDLSGIDCHQLNNAKIELATNLGVTLISATIVNPYFPINVTNNNTIELGNLTPNNYTIVYYLRLGCNVKAPDVLTVDAVLKGDNCEIPNQTIFTFPQLNFALPVFSNTVNSTYVTISDYGITPTTASFLISNDGSIPANVVAQTLFPNVKINSIDVLQGGPQNTSVTNVYGCGSSPNIIATQTNNGVLNISQTASKAIYTITDLRPGISVMIRINYDSSSSCILPTQTGNFNFTHSLTARGFLLNDNYCNCSPGEGTRSFTQAYAPRILCSPTIDNATCIENNDIKEYEYTIFNYGRQSLDNPIIEFPISSQFASFSNFKFNGLSIIPTINSAGTHYVITLPSSIVAGTYNNILKYTATFVANIEEGNHNLLSGTTVVVKGDQNYSTMLTCGRTFKVCPDGGPTIIKEIYDAEDETFKNQASGQAGANTKYKFTIKNGNTKISNIQIVDRLSHIGDKYVTSNCDPRNSQFEVTALGTFSPSYPSGTTITATYTNSMAGTTSLPNNFASPQIGSCNPTNGIYNNTLGNTILIDFPTVIPPFGEESFTMDVAIPASATKGQVANNTAVLNWKYIKNDLTTSSPSSPLETINLAQYTIAPPPCKNCPEILKSTKLEMNEEVENVPNQDFVVTTGVLTFTTIKPIQEIHLSVADLVYTFDKEGCTDCKTPAMARGCLFPTSQHHQIGTNATTGYLKFEEIDPNHLYGNPNSMNDQQCSEELSWGLGVMLKPGTYQIPFTLTLPKSVIPECCMLEIEKFNVKLSLKDADCMVCENIISPNTDNCCSGGSWASKYIQSQNPRFEEAWLTEDFNTIPQARIAKMSYEEKNIRKAISFNKSKLDKGEEAEMAQVFWAPQRINCGEKIFLKEGETKIFAAAYNCNTSMERCNGEVKISIKKIIGNYDINVDNRASGFRQQFPSAGEYKVTYTPYCGGRPCGEPCVFTIIVQKDCCATVKKNGATKVTSYRLGGIRNAQTLLVTDLTSNSQSISSNNIVDVKLNYSCPTGCTPSYQWQRIRNGVVIETQIATSATFQINTPSEGRIKDKIRITVKCGETLCESVYEEFELSCNNCLLGSANPPFPGGGVVSPNNPTGSIYTESHTMSPNVGNVENLQEDTCQGGIWTEKRYRTYVVNGIETRGSGEISFDIWPNYIELIKADYGFQPCVKFKCNNNQMATDFKIIKKNLTTNTETICSSLYSPLGNNDSCWKFVAQGIQGTSIFKCLIPENTVNRYTIIPICNGTPCEDAKFVFDLVKK